MAAANTMLDHEYEYGAIITALFGVTDIDATLNAVRKPPKEDPMLKERSRFWRKHAPPRFKLEAISATQDRRDL